VAGRQRPGQLASLRPGTSPAAVAAAQQRLATAHRESQEHSQAHVGGAGYQVPVWPDRRTAWISEPPPAAGGPRVRGIGGIR
jgi:hypothetical protein